MIQYIWGKFTIFGSWSSVAFGYIKRALFPLIFVSGFLLAAYAAYVNTMDPSGFGLLDDVSRPFWVQFGSISALVLILLKPVWDIWKGDGHLQHKVVTDADKTDMKQMQKFMNGADSVIIYSGDFSYIHDHDPLYNTLLGLAEREVLTFISYKKENTVFERSNEKKGSNECIITKLTQSGKISFGVPGEAKFSLIQRRGEEVLLYRHRDQDVDYVTIFRANNGMAKQLVKMINTLASVVIRLQSKK